MNPAYFVISIGALTFIATMVGLIFKVGQTMGRLNACVNANTNATTELYKRVDKLDQSLVGFVIRLTSVESTQNSKDPPKSKEW